MVNQVNDQFQYSSTSNYPTEGTGKSQLGKDDFMKLMIAQLKNQDPLNPMDGSEYAAQLAQFSSLEQLQNMNDSMNNSIDANYVLTQSINNTLSANLIGKFVKLGGNEITNNTTNNVTIGYNLQSEVTSAKINVYNSNGVLVKVIDNVELSKGEHKLSYDFSDNNGSKLPAGKYTFEVEAIGQGAVEVSVDVFKYGQIDAVRYTENGTKLMVGNIEYLLSDISEIVNVNKENEN